MRLNTLGKTLPLLIGITLSACTLFNPPPFSQKELHWADREILFKDLDHHMKSLEGTKVILGGEILSVQWGKTKNRIIVKDFPLGPEFHPDMDKPSMGEFVIDTDQEVPGDRYHKGHTIEVIGEVRAPIRIRSDGKSPLVPLVWAHHLHAQAPTPPPSDPVMEDPALVDPEEADPGYMYPTGTGDPFMWW